MENCLFDLLIARFWLYFFDTQLIMINKNQEWRMLIDPINDVNDNNTNSCWFVKNINKWGNQYFIIKLVALKNVVIATGELIVNSFASDAQRRNKETNNYELAGTIGRFALWFIILGLLFYIRHLALQSNFVDRLGIIKEFNVSTLTITIMANVIMAISVCAQITDNQMLFVAWSLCFLPYSIIYFYFIIFYPKRLFESMKSKSKAKSKIAVDKKKKSPLTLTSLSSPLMSDRNDQFANKNITVNSWKHIVCIYQGYDAIMNYLEKEFSIENLLFIQEVILRAISLCFLV